MQGLAQIFYFTTVRKAVALTISQEALSTSQPSSVAATALADNRAFAVRLAFLLRPLLARTELLLQLLRLPPKKLPEEVQPPPSGAGPLLEVGVPNGISGWLTCCREQSYWARVPGKAAAVDVHSNLHVRNALALTLTLTVTLSRVLA